MPISERGNEIDLVDTNTSSYGNVLRGDHDNTSIVNNVITALDKQRSENEDNRVLDDILANPRRYPTNVVTDPIEAEKIAVNEDMSAIMLDIANTNLMNPDGMTMDEYAAFKKIQEENSKNKQEDDAMSEIEREIMEHANTPIGSMNIGSDINEDDLQEADRPEEIFQEESSEINTEAVVSNIEETNSDIMGEAIQVNNDMPHVVAVGDGNSFTNAVIESIGEEDTPVEEAADENFKGMTDEELQDVPVSNLDVTNEQVLTNMKNITGEISDADAGVIIDIMTRYKAGEKFSVFNALPESIKNQIRKAAMENGDGRHAILEFFAKNLINDIISDAFMSTEIKNFQDELNTYAKATGNVPGIIIDSYSDELKEKFEDNMLSIADKLSETEPERAEQLRNIAKYFKSTYTLDIIKNHIENGGDVYINRCYKKARKLTQYVLDFNEYFANVEPKIRDITTLAIPFRQLMLEDDVADTLAIMLGDSCLELPKGDLVTNVYAFYLLSGIMNITMSANTSDLIRELRDNLADIIVSIRQFLYKREHDPKYSKKKKGKKRGR